jgi:hypothetical protein
MIRCHFHACLFIPSASATDVAHSLGFGAGNEPGTHVNNTVTIIDFPCPTGLEKVNTSLFRNYY